MSRRYVPKTGQRPQSERRLAVRSERREVPDYDKLTQLLIRLSLQPPRDTATSDHQEPSGLVP